MPIRVLLADDHTLIRQGLRRILEATPEFAVVAEANSGLEAIELAEKHRPDVAVLDIGMSELNGIEAANQIRRKTPDSKIMILSMYGDERYVTRAIRVGASAYLLKDSVDEDLVKAIRLVHQGQSYFSPAVARTLADGYARDLKAREVEDRYELLTERQRQIYHLLAEGRSNKQVAGRLNLSLNTVETHRVRIMEKLDVHSAAELVLSAVRRGLIS